MAPPDPNYPKNRVSVTWYDSSGKLACLSPVTSRHMVLGSYVDDLPDLTLLSVHHTTQRHYTSRQQNLMLHRQC